MEPLEWIISASMVQSEPRIHKGRTPKTEFKQAFWKHILFLYFWRNVQLRRKKTSINRNFWRCSQIIPVSDIHSFRPAPQWWWMIKYRTWPLFLVFSCCLISLYALERSSSPANMQQKVMLKSEALYLEVPNASLLVISKYFFAFLFQNNNV